MIESSRQLIEALSNRRGVLIATALVVLSCISGGMKPVRASDRAFVPDSDPEWGGRLAEIIELAAAGAKETIGDGVSGDTELAVDLLRRALESEGRVLVRVPADLDIPLPVLAGDLRRPRAPVRGAAADGRRFVPLSIAARAILAKLPEATRRVYDRAVQPSLRRLDALYAETLDSDVLRQIASSFPTTASGRRALEMLADMATERGDDRIAYSFYSNLFATLASGEATNPAPTGEAQSSAGRLGIKLLRCLRQLGEGDLYAESRPMVLSRVKDASERSKLEASVESLEATSVLLPRSDRPLPRRASRWGGELAVGQLPALPSRRFRFSWDSWAWSDSQAVVLSTLHGRFDARGGVAFNSRYVDYPFMPLIDSGHVWMSSVYWMYQIDSRPGHGKALLKVNKPDPAGLRRGLSYYFREHSDTCVYPTTRWRRALDASPEAASIPFDEAMISTYISDLVVSDQFMGYDVSAELPVRSLIAMHPSTGKTLWRTTPFDKDHGRVKDGDAIAMRRERARTAANRPRVDELERFAPVEIPADICYSSPAVVADGRVYVGGWIEKGFTNSKVRALDLATGKKIWETHLSSVQMEQTMFGELAREPFASFIVEREGVLYCQTNLGVVAALDAQDGQVLWLTTYDYVAAQNSNGRTANFRRLSWGPNAPLLVGHVLIVAPRDSRFLYAIDTGTGPNGPSVGGAILWRYSNATGDLRDMIGYANKRLYFTGEPGVAYLDLEAMKPDGRLDRVTPRKVRPKMSRAHRGVPTSGFLTDSGVVYADETNLWLVDLDLAKARVPLLNGFRHSDHGQYPGRVQLQDGQLFVTSNNLLSSYAPVSDAEVKSPPSLKKTSPPLDRAAAVEGTP